MRKFGQFSLDEVIKHIGKPYATFWVPSQRKLFRVKMGTQRMLLMKRQQACACCGIKATHFSLECSGCFSPHFNLYAKDQMLTVDHIIPKSKGGETKQDNLQLLCKKM